VILPAVPCLVALLALISPRLALFFIWIFSNLLDRAYDGWLVPLLGFFVLPWTTLIYAVMWDSGTNSVEGIEWLFVILAFLIDLGSWGLGGRGRRSRRREPAYDS
jgi:hypothetical protein